MRGLIANRPAARLPRGRPGGARGTQACDVRGSLVVGLAVACLPIALGCSSASPAEVGDAADASGAGAWRDAIGALDSGATRREATRR